MSLKPIELYTWGTPNGIRPTILLEELGIPYNVHPVDISTGEQKKDWFLKINPNGRIPAITDPNNHGYRVFEGGSILLYLVEHYDKENKFSFGANSDGERIELFSWLFWQHGGIAPMQGQLNHFNMKDDKIDYAVKRYHDETKRLYSTLDAHLGGADTHGESREYIAGNGKGKYTIADIATWPWVAFSNFSGVDLKEFPHLQKWFDRIDQRPATKKAVDVPKENQNVNGKRELRKI